MKVAPAAIWVDSTVQADGLEPTSIRSAKIEMSLTHLDPAKSVLDSVSQEVRRREECH